MCITEYNEEIFVNGIKEEGREEGRKEGMVHMLWLLVNEGVLTIEEAAKKAGTSVENLEEKIKEYNFNE